MLEAVVLRAAAERAVREDHTLSGHRDVLIVRIARNLGARGNTRAIRMMLAGGESARTSGRCSVNVVRPSTVLLDTVLAITLFTPPAAMQSALLGYLMSKLTKRGVESR